jgi:phosphoglycerate dehydrogenase-like enzyme
MAMLCLSAIPKSVFSDCFDMKTVERLDSMVQLIPADPFHDLPDPITPEWMSRYLAQTEILLTGWGTPPLSDAMIQNAPKLKAIVHSAGSVKALVPPSVFERKIAVTNARHALARGVAETTLGMIIASAKMFLPLNGQVRQGGWFDGPFKSWTKELYEITVGIVAASEVGKHLLYLLGNFEVDRLVYDPYADSKLIEKLGARKVELDELCSKSDVIAVCAPSTPETFHLIGKNQFRLMKDGVRLINTARGAIIDEDALADNLRAGRLYAMLDVTDPEPPAPDSILRTSAFVTLTPHIAGHAANGKKRQGKLVVDEIEKFFSEGKFRWQVNRDSLTRMG